MKGSSYHSACTSGINHHNKRTHTGCWALQEPELLEQVNMATGAYEAVAATRVHEALEAATGAGRMRAAGAASARGGELAAADTVRLLDKASDLYFQVGRRKTPALAS